MVEPYPDDLAGRSSVAGWRIAAEGAWGVDSSVAVVVMVAEGAETNIEKCVNELKSLRRRRNKALFHEAEV